MTSALWRRGGALALAMLTAAGLALALKPRTKVADLGPKVDLELLIPKQFGDWRLDESIAPLELSPEVKAKLDRIYNQTLSRTYINPRGQRIMLSIAYGGDQSDAMQVHRPEICYAAQGFAVGDEALGRVATDDGELPVKRLVASQQGLRVEPITYWITVGDEATYVGIRQKLVQLKYGLTGRIPDGMLVRVSSIDRDAAAAYGLQESFIARMLAAVDAKDRIRLSGRR